MLLCHLQRRVPTEGECCKSLFVLLLPSRAGFTCPSPAPVRCFKVLNSSVWGNRGKFAAVSYQPLENSQQLKNRSLSLVSLFPIAPECSGTQDTTFVHRNVSVPLCHPSAVILCIMNISLSTVPILHFLYIY